MARPSSFFRSCLNVELLEDRSVPAALGGEVLPVMVAFDQTALNKSVVPANSIYDGVATLDVTTVGGQRYRGSGSLLKDSSYTYDFVLTAAHMVVDDQLRKVTSVTIKWGDGTTATTTSAADIIVHEGWNGDPLQGNDIAIVRIAQLTSTAPDRYELFRERTTDPSRLGQPEVPEVFTKVGYGLPGTGSKGYTNNSSLFGTLRVGQNRYDDTYTPTSNSNWNTHTVLAYDFDSGKSSNDVIGRFFGIRDLGLGKSEAFAAPGDSGGPSFIGGKIAGVTSAIQSLFFGDARQGVNASFGEIGYDTRVALFADWVDAVMSGATQPQSQTTSTSGGGTTQSQTFSGPSGGATLAVGVFADRAGWLAPEDRKAASSVTETHEEGESEFADPQDVSDARGGDAPAAAFTGTRWDDVVMQGTSEDWFDIATDCLGGVEVE